MNPKSGGKVNPEDGPRELILTVSSMILGGFMGYSGGRTIRPWYIPVSKSESSGPRIVKCHSNKLSCKKMIR